MYVGYKAGRPNMSNSYMDIGSLIIEWNKMGRKLGQK